MPFVPRQQQASFTFLVALMTIAGWFLDPEAPHAAPVRVRYAEGLAHGFLVLRALDGRRLADGDLTQVVRGSRLTTRVVFHFRDGSLHDETVVYSQDRHFRLLSDRLVQRGPTFPRPMDFSIDTRAGLVLMRTVDDGKEKVEGERMDLPADLSNGLLQILLKNDPSGWPSETLSLVAATPKPMLVKLIVTRAGEEPIVNGGLTLQATHYVLKVDIPGIKGVIAPLIGKHPPDNHIWILRGGAPAFLKARIPLYVDGPICDIELSSPSWPGARRAPQPHSRRQAAKR